MRLRSPAKVNLFLRVLHKRNDGYHEIETLFERISLADEIILKSARSGIRLKCAAPLPQGPANLAYQAAKLLRDELEIKKGVEITIQKKIPVAAGLGGGSSNAATVILGLNRLWKLRLPRKKMLQFASRLGSDVPFFILEAPLALGKGRGEILTEIKRPSVHIWHCLVKPRFKISTKAAYAALKGSSLTPQKTDVRMLLHSIQKGPSKALSKLLTNSLEVTLNKRVIDISSIKKILMNYGALGALMSGSGSTVFGIFSSKGLAQKAAGLLKKKNRSWQVFVASTY